MKIYKCLFGIGLISTLLSLLTFDENIYLITIPMFGAYMLMLSTYYILNYE